MFADFVAYCLAGTLFCMGLFGLISVFGTSVSRRSDNAVIGASLLFWFAAWVAARLAGV